MAKKQFKAESKRLLDLMINSIYTHKEIFLREIISNASDAIDKLCYVALTDDKVGMNRSDFAITVSVDKENRTLTVSDNGIGMSREELENNLGVIASSGSYKFRQETEEKDKKDADIDIIGQFGVGFYSAFMVADSITVRTKKYGEEQAYEWQSSGADGYTITECDKEAVGTDVIMHIKPDTDEEKYSEYLESYRLHALVKKYSDYIRYPIRMLLPEQKVKEGSDPEKPEYETVEEMKTVNSMVPLWQRKKSDVTDEEYNKFYSELTHEFDKPQRTITVSAEGSVTYKALLFVPSSRPFNFYTEGYEKGLQLYSAGVLIMDKCDSLLPDYLRFVRGVVDSPDLSLNISRELLQHDRQLKVIGQNLEKKVRADLEKFLKDDREGYEKFYENFGRQIGYGIVSDGGESRKDSLKDLMMFYSSTQKKLTTLKEYVERMKEGQKCIYYAAGESIAAVDKLPQTELLKDKVPLHRGRRPRAWRRGRAQGRQRERRAHAVRQGDARQQDQGGQGLAPPEDPSRLPDGGRGLQLRDGKVLQELRNARACQGRAHPRAERRASGGQGDGSADGDGSRQGRALCEDPLRSGEPHRGAAARRSQRVHRHGRAADAVSQYEPKGRGEFSAPFFTFFIPAAYTGIQALFRLTNRKGDERICFDH